MMAMKNKITAGLLAIFLGGLGIHKFYLGKYGQGIIYLLLCWTYIPAIIALIEGLVYLTYSDSAFQAKYCKDAYQFDYRSGQTANSFPHDQIQIKEKSVNKKYTPIEIPQNGNHNTLAKRTSLDLPEAVYEGEYLDDATAASLIDENTLSEEEKDYLEEYRSYILDGVISDKERRLLDKLCELSGISKERAKQLENLV